MNEVSFAVRRREVNKAPASFCICKAAGNVFAHYRLQENYSAMNPCKMLADYYIAQACFDPVFFAVNSFVE